MALANLSRNFPSKFNNIAKISLAQVNQIKMHIFCTYPNQFSIDFFLCIPKFSSEHRIKGKKLERKVGFESKPDINNIDCDYIGPADKVSNLRPVLRHVPADETSIEKELRLKRIEVEQWNQTFWTKHNQSFVKVRILIACVMFQCHLWNRLTESMNLCFFFLKM